MVSESKIGTLHVIIGSCWYSCYCACVSVHPCRYVLYVCCARTVLSYMWNVYLYCFMLHLERMWLSVRMYVRTPVCVFVPYYRNLNTPLFLADMAPFLVYRMYDVYWNVQCVSFLVYRNSVFRFMLCLIRSRYRFFDI